jgi:hypothetical protein
VFTLLLIFCVYAFNLYLIPKYGIVGAAVSTGFVYVLYNILRGWYISKVYALNPFRLDQAKLILAFILFSLFYYFIFIISEDFAFISSTVLRILFKEIFLFVGFIIPIYWLNLEPESVSYIKSWIKKTV